MTVIRRKPLQAVATVEQHDDQQTMKVQLAPGRSRETDALVDGVYDVVQFLTMLEGWPPSGRALISVDIAALDDPQQRGEAEAYVEAVKGLMQSWVLERRSDSCPVNLVVADHDSDQAAVSLTANYFLDPLGSFSRGSTIDLRGN